jgi:hypothetical protein
MIVRDRVCEPPPQSLVHADHWFQAECRQSAGHGVSAQAWVWILSWHTVPPLEAWTVILRVRVLLPVPHVCEQVVHRDQGEYLQSTAQLCGMQA